MTPEKATFPLAFRISTRCVGSGLPYRAGQPDQSLRTMNPNPAAKDPMSPGVFLVCRTCKLLNSGSHFDN